MRKDWQSTKISLLPEDLERWRALCDREKRSMSGQLVIMMDKWIAENYPKEKETEE